MKITPTLEECKNIAAQGHYGVIPLSCELYADMTTPIEVLRILKKVSGHVYLLESAEADKRWGRYSFLGYDPLLEITCYNGTTTIKSELTSRTDSGDVRQIIREVMEENKSPKLPGLPSFTGGLVGYFSYDYIKYSEPTLKLEAKDEEGFQDVNLMLFHKVIAFDNYRQKLILILNVKTEDLKTNYHRAERELSSMKELLLNGEKVQYTPCQLKTEFQPLFDEKAYCEMVGKAKHYIREGDIFQVVLSNRLEAEMEGSLLDASNSFNISTTASLAISAAGVPVAKHGNRAASSKSGAADCLEALGANIALEPEQSKKLLEETGICFLFAQKYHTAMKYVGPVRKGLGIRTIFNILGPLANPAGPVYQIMGVYDENLLAPMEQVLSNLGVKRGMVVYGQDRLDEISASAPTSVCEIDNGSFKNYVIAPEDFGLERGTKEDLVGGTPQENAEITRAILNGEKGPKRNEVLLNAAAALYGSGKADRMADGVKLAERLLTADLPGHSWRDSLK